MKSLRWMLGAVAVAALTAPALAQDWPTRPITLVVPFAAGGGVDSSARIQALAMGEILGQTIVMLTPSVKLSSAHGRWVPEPTPAEPYCILAWFAFM